MTVARTSSIRTHTVSNVLWMRSSRSSRKHMAHHRQKNPAAPAQNLTIVVMERTDRLGQNRSARFERLHPLEGGAAQPRRLGVEVWIVDQAVVGHLGTPQGVQWNRIPVGVKNPH